MDQRPIGIFDSGLGGLTVADAVMAALPGESVLYFGDTERCPYGPRPRDDVRRFVLQIGQWLATHDVKMLVVACNTGTAAGLQVAQRTFDVPVIGVIEPGARAAVTATRNRKVGVIGTVGTVESGAYSRAVRAIDEGVTVYSIATPRFVELVEAGLRMDVGTLEEWFADASDVFIRPAFYEMARDYLDPLKRNGVDTLVLGCTHFPLLSTAIGQVMGPRVRLISSAQETAREVAGVLGSRRWLAPHGNVPRHAFHTTGDPVEFARLGSTVLRRPIKSAHHLPLDALEGIAIPPMRAENVVTIEEEGAACS
jgi:glutamate racemase